MDTAAYWHTYPTDWRNTEMEYKRENESKERVKLISGWR